MQAESLVGKTIGEDMKNSIVSIVSIVLVFLTVFGCVPMSLAAPETSGIGQIAQGIKPRIKIEFEVANINGQYSSASQASLNPSNGKLNLRAIASNGNPMGSIEVSFLGSSNSCVVNGSVYNGYFPINGLLAPIKQTNTSPVQYVLTLPFTIKSPLTCKVLGNPTVTGYPNNAKITIQAVSKLLSNYTTKRDFIVTLKL